MRSFGSLALFKRSSPRERQPICFGTFLRATLVAAAISVAAPANATLYEYTATLNAAQVVDGGGSTSTATGDAVVTVDDSLFTVTTDVTWSGLSGPADRAHLHFAPWREQVGGRPQHVFLPRGDRRSSADNRGMQSSVYQLKVDCGGTSHLGCSSGS
jgi:hypothetical protein